MIEVFPNKLDGGPCDTVKTDRRMTIAQWLNTYCKDGYQPGENMPISVKVEDEIIEESEWPTFVFKPSDYVEVRIEPRGTDPFSITVALFAGAKAVLGMLMPKLPGTPNVPGQGDALSQGSARGNKVKLGQVIRESFGTQKIYPDYLVPPHKYFSDPRTQQVRFLMNIGVGDFQINASNVCIGDTALLALGLEAEYRIYPPGAYLGDDPGCQWWHTAPEVGASSTGAAGLELTASTSITPNVVASSMVFNGYTVTIPGGAGSFPTDWTTGLVLRMLVPYTYTVTDGGGAARDIITGPLGMLAPVVGQSVEVAGTNAGLYTVASWTGTNLTLDFAGGAPANGLILGSGQAAIGPAGLRFKITSISPSSMTVQRLDASGSPDLSFPGFDALTTSSASVSLDSSSLEGGWRGPFPACPINEVTKTLEIDVFYPEGLCGIGQDGNLYPLTVSYELQYRDMAAAGAWTSVPLANTNSTLDQVGFSPMISLPYFMRPEVRMRKLSPLSENLEYHDTVQWYGLKCLLAGPARYAGCTVITGRVQTSDRISAQTESQINVVGTRILPVRQSGAWLPAQPTRAIAPAALYVVRSLGMSDASVDLAELDRLADGVWRTRGDHFDMAINDESTAKDVLNNIFGCGFSELTIDRGLIRPVRDEPRTLFEHMYSPQNYTERLTIESTLPNENDFTGVQVTFQDATTWTESTVDCPPGSGGSRRVEKVEAPGITDIDKAFQFGMRRYNIHQYRRDTYSFSTEEDALNSRYLGYEALGDDVPGYGQSAILKSFSGTNPVILESSEPFDWSVPGTYMAALRKVDGSLSGPYTATRIDDYHFSVPFLDFTPVVDRSDNMEPPHILFGPANRWTYPVLITSVNPRGTNGASVEAVGYDARVYLSDDSLAP